MIVDSKGRIFFTDPMYDHRSWEQEEQPVRGVYRIDTDGSVHLVVANIHHPNGLALSPDESMLYVCNYDFGKNGPFLVADDFKGDMPPVASQLFAFDLRADGTTKFRKVVVDLSPQSGCDGIKVDEKGNIYVAAGAVPYLYVYTPDGQAARDRHTSRQESVPVEWQLRPRKIRSHAVPRRPRRNLQDRDEVQGRGVAVAAPPVPSLPPPGSFGTSLLGQEGCFEVRSTAFPRRVVPKVNAGGWRPKATARSTG